MRPIVGNNIVILYVYTYVKRVRIIGEVGAIIDVILRHLSLFATCAVIDRGLLSMVGRWDLGAGGKRGPGIIRKSGGPLALKQRCRYTREYRTKVSYRTNGSLHKLPSAGGRTSPTRSIYRQRDHR